MEEKTSLAPIVSTLIFLVTLFPCVEPSGFTRDLVESIYRWDHSRVRSRVSRFSNFVVLLESCCTFIHQSRERSTRELFILAFQLIVSHLYISTERGGGYPLVDSIKGYPKEFHWRVTRSWWLEEWFWKLSRPIPLLHFFLQSRAHSYGKHAPEMESVALHYIHLRVRAAISGRKSAGRGGTLPLNRFKNSLWDSCHLGTTCTTNLDVWLAAQCFWNTFLIFHFLSYVDCSIRNFIVM
jgi:hypothetical protein